MLTDQVVQAFRGELKEIIPNLIEEVIWTREEAAEEHYQLLICKIIEETCSFRTEVKSIFYWLGMDDDFFVEHKIDETPTFAEFFKVFKNKGGGLQILRALLNVLEDLDVELAQV